MSEELKENIELKTENNLDSILENSANDIPPIVEINSINMNTLASADRTEADVLSGSAVFPDKKKRGRPKKPDLNNPVKSATTPRPILSGIQNNINPAINSNDAAIEPCAEILVMMTNASGMVLAQSDAGAMTKDEAMLAKSGYVAYLKTKGVDNVPAWVILAGSLCPYYLRIITTTPAKTTVASGLRKGWFGIKEFFISRKNKKNAQFNSRDDFKRENNTGEETGTKNL